jgi:hypothetical protein
VAAVAIVDTLLNVDLVAGTIAVMAAATSIFETDRTFSLKKRNSGGRCTS